MKYLLIASLFSLLSTNSFALGEQASPNFDCCHTGLCGNKPMCPGVSRKTERREARQARKEKRRAARSSARGA
jgi:hypothetical protein